MLRDSALLSFFLPLTRRTCAELGVGDDTIAAYLAEVMAEFARTDRLYHLRAPGGARLESVVEMLGLGPPTPGPAGTRAFHRYVGDFALFMSGLFRSFVELGGYLGYYLAEGARAYARASALAEGEPRARRPLGALPARAAPRVPRQRARARGVLALQGRDLAPDLRGRAQRRAPRARRPGARRARRAPRHTERRRPPRAERLSARAPGQHPRHGLRGRVHGLPPARAARGRAGGLGGGDGRAALRLRRAVEAGHHLLRAAAGGRGPGARARRGVGVRPLRRRGHVAGGRAGESDVPRRTRGGGA